MTESMHPAKVLAVIVLCITVILTATLRAEAFKIDAHIYAAQEVLNDAADGTLDFPILDKDRRVIRTHKIPVNPTYLRAIRAYPEYYRMGSVGPDAFPSVEVGQLAIHPGLRGSWGTAEWLNHLLQTSRPSDQELAFILGNFAHAAVDVFAHTYVNRYVGEIFDIGLNEPAARRHVMIESFISRFLPPIKVSGSRREFRAHELVTDRNGKLAIPAQMLRNRMFYHPSAVEQLGKGQYTRHIRLIANHREKLNKALAKGSPLDEIELAAIQISAAIWGDINLSKNDARRVREYSEKIHNMTDFTVQSVELVNQYDKALKGLSSFTHQQVGKLFQKSESAMKDYLAGAAKLAAMRKQALSRPAEIEKMTREKVTKAVTNVLCRRKRKRCPPHHDHLCKLICDNVVTVVDITNETVASANAALKELQSHIDKLEQSQDRVLKAIHESLKEAMKGAETLIATKIKLNEFVLEFLKDQKPAHSPPRRIIENWGRDIDEAMLQYVHANGETLIRSITPGAEDILKPYLDWFECYGKAIVGYPVLISKGVCILKDGKKALVAHLDEFEARLSRISSTTELINRKKKEIQEKITKLKDELIDEGTDHILKEFDRLKKVNANLLMWKKLLTEPTKDGVVNGFFSKDPSGKGLLVIGDIEQRMRIEMGIRDNQPFDPQRFDAMRNSIMLAKLALLDQRGLQELASKEGLGTTFYGPQLYPGDSHYSQNILFGFARSIDGNNQWHMQSPPHPRVGGYDKETFARQRKDASARYGYVNNNCVSNNGERTKGMRMWVDGSARQKLFNRIFTGPVVPGVDYPALLGSTFKPVLHPSYPQTVTADSPWGEDGIEIDLENRGSSAFTKVRMFGSGVPGLSVKVMISGRLPIDTQIDAKGTWNVDTTIQDWRLDECFVVEVLRRDGRPSGQPYLQSFRHALSNPITSK